MNSIDCGSEKRRPSKAISRGVGAQVWEKI